MPIRVGTMPDFGNPPCPSNGIGRVLQVETLIFRPTVLSTINLKLSLL